MTCEVSIVMPAFNEEACIVRVVEDLGSALRGMDWEIIVVDNGSTDRTGLLADDLAARHPRVRILRLRSNSGYGGAIQEGLRQARGGILGFTASDGEVGAEDVVRVLQVLQRCDVSFVKGKRIGRVDGAWRKLMSVGYHFFVGMLFSMHVADVNGFPVFFRRAWYETLSLTRRNWMINVELLHQARAARLRSAEVDVEHQVRAGGRSHVRWHFAITFATQLLGYWLDLRGKKKALPKEGLF